MAPYAKGALAPTTLGYEKFYKAFDLPNTDIASLVILVAIKESQGNVRINFAQYFTGCGDSSNPYHPARRQRKNNIMNIYKRVSERLSNPITLFEKEVASGLTGDNKSYWTSPLIVPNLADLPMPSEQFISALDQMIRATEEMKIMNPYVTRRGMKPMPQGIRTALGMAFGDAEEASAEIDKLRQEGRLGFKMPKPTGKPPIDPG